MLEDLPQDIKDGFDAAYRRAQRQKGRMRIGVEGRTLPIQRYWEQGFALAPADAAHMRGHVDLYDGARHLGRCLIVASGMEGGEMVYEFKRKTPVSDRPPLDFAPDDHAPMALLL